MSLTSQEGDFLHNLSTTQQLELLVSEMDEGAICSTCFIHGFYTIISTTYVSTIRNTQLVIVCLTHAVMCLFQVTLRRVGR